MLNKEEIEKDIKVLKNISECFTFSMWTDDTKALKRVLNYIEQLESELEESRKETMQIYDDYQDIGKMFFDLDEKVQKLIKKLEEDVNRKIPLAEDMDWVMCRKQYAQEILSLLKGEKE